MEYRTLDVTVLSAEDLKKVTHFGRMQPYAVIWIDPRYRSTTRVDKDGHSNPSWNEHLSLSVPEHLLHQPGASLHVEVYSKGSIFRHKFVGMAIISLSELMQQSGGKQVLMYELRRKRSGKLVGAVRLSVHIGDKTAVPNPYHAQGYGGYPAYPPQGYNYPPQPGYYPQPPQHPGMMGGRMGGNSMMGGRMGGNGMMGGRMGGMGMGTGLLAGALGGLVVGDMIDDAFDGGYDGGGFDGGFDGGGFDGGF